MSRQGAGIPRTKTLANTQLEPTAQGDERAAAQLQTLARLEHAMIFVSHRETDAALAKALVDFLRASLELPSGKIRCTSVPGFQLPFGKTISDQLKDDIGASNAVFVLITQASLQSRWVIFELVPRL